MVEADMEVGDARHLREHGRFDSRNSRPPPYAQRVFDEIVAVVTAVGAAATAIAVFVGVLQLRTAKEQARTAFEDDLSREYRTIVGELPAEAFYVDGKLPPSEMTRRAFYRYVDLSNEQLFLARVGRVSAATEAQWKDGIRGNLERLPAFSAAWREITAHVPRDFFEDLRELVPPRPSEEEQSQV